MAFTEQRHWLKTIKGAGGAAKGRGAGEGHVITADLSRICRQVVPVHVRVCVGTHDALAWEALSFARPSTQDVGEGLARSGRRLRTMK